jgi:hypothetical protein
MMETEQRELFFAFLLSAVFAAGVSTLGFFGLGVHPLYSFLFLLSLSAVGFLLAFKVEHAGMRTVFAVFLYSTAFLVAALKSGLGLVIIATVAVPALFAAVLSTLGPVRKIIFAKK